MPPFVLVELERVFEDAGQSLDVERVARQRLVELVRRTGELAEDEDAGTLARTLADNELLRDQVHPVA